MMPEREEELMIAESKGAASATIKEPCFWSCHEDNEQLTHESLDEAVEHYLDDLLHPKMSPTEVLAALPGSLDVYGYARDDGPSEKEQRSWAMSLVEQLVEWIDDEYGDPDGGGCGNENEPACQDIAREMVETALQNYVVWRCSKVETKTINVEEWVRRERPDWLVEAPCER